MQKGLIQWCLFALIGLLGCASPPPDQAFDKVANSRVQRILLLQVPEPRLRVINLGSAYAAFGLVGAALGDDDEETKSSELEAQVREQLRLGRALTTALAGELKSRGFEVKVDNQLPISDAGPDTAPVNERFDYGLIETNADAILHVSFVNAGYLATATSTDYQPWLYVRARLVSGRSKAPLYSQLMVFGANFPEIKAHLPAAPQYAYSSFEKLMANHVAATAGLGAGTEAVAASIAQQLR